MTPTVTITSPIASATISSNAVQIEGTFTGPTNTGISVAGVPATVVGNRFASELVSLDEGATTITVTAKTIDGLTASSAINLTIAAPPAQDFTISDATKVGFAPYKIKPSFAINDIADVQNVSIDFNGDGTNDYIGSLANVPVYTYATPGIYRLRTILTTPTRSYTRFRTVAVASLVETRARSCAVYAHLKARLRANDTAGALQSLAKPIRAPFQELFTALANNRPAFADRLGTIANSMFSPVDAEMVLVNEDGAELVGAVIHLIQMGDGVWRIDGL